VAVRDGDRLTVGVEEEYLVVDPVSRAVRPEADSVIAHAAKELGDGVSAEITRFQIEARTDPHTQLAGLGAQIRSMRAAVAEAAALQGLRVVSSGSPVLGAVIPPPLTEGPRYARSFETFRALDDEQSVCACHVHVGLADRSRALAVSNHLRPWLPVLVALGANSPYWAGRDTGYASWRTVTWARWPVAGPPPFFQSVTHFEELVGQFSISGSITDRSGLYWDVRPSEHVPTLEVRVADAAMTVEDTLLLTAVTRALVDTALRAVEIGEPAPNPSPEALRAAYWRAARDGLGGQGFDLRTGRLVPAAVLADGLLVHVSAALERHGDLGLVRAGWAQLRAHGTGADRQRAAYRRRARLHDVVDCLIAMTTQGI
jgi:glutamate---cysteine ligase / carboxylate-amine ligase